MIRTVILDTETTGTDVQRDQIIELCIQDGIDPPRLTDMWRIKPTVAIHPEATKVHGITAADVAQCPSFAQVAPRIVALLNEAEVIVGFNVRFDIDILQAELARAGLPPLDLINKHVVDAMRLWQHFEPRTLVAAHEKFVGYPFSGAHGAASDVAATGRVLTAMLVKFDLLDKAWPELAAIANPFAGREKWIGPSNHIQWDGAHAVFCFGKYQGARVGAVDVGFLRWVVGKDFPPHVKEICREACQRRPDDLDAWISQRYPRPATQSEAA